jgi:HlyD family secretion protein
VQPGTVVELAGWGQPQRVAGGVRKIEPSAFTRPSALGVEEQRVNVIITLTEPREHWSALGDGYHIEARLILWQGDNVLKLPSSAVFRHGNSWATFELEAGTAQLRPLTLGHRGDTEVEVLSGIDQGATVIVHPGDRIQDGVRAELN